MTSVTKILSVVKTKRAQASCFHDIGIYLNKFVTKAISNSKLDPTPPLDAYKTFRKHVSDIKYNSNKDSLLKYCLLT